MNAIRGQTGKGRRGMTDPADRREAIAAALAECPVGQWVSADDFLKYLRAAGHEFEVTKAPWRLYFSEAQYGSLGDANTWRILEFRYLLCFLMEYAGTLGLLDLAYLPPAGARRLRRRLGRRRPGLPQPLRRAVLLPRQRARRLLPRTVRSLRPAAAGGAARS